MNPKEATTTDAMASFRKTFKSPGIIKVCTWAVAARSSGRYAAAARGVTELKKQIEASEDGSLAKMRLEADLVALEARASEYSSQAQAAATNSWRTHDALQLVARDLERFCADLGAAVEKGITDTRRFWNAQGWGSPSDEIILATVKPLAELKLFAEQHALPALQMFRVQLEVSASGQKLGDSFQPDAVTWITHGCSWNEIKP